MLLMKFIFITHPPVRKRRHTISVLSWAPRIPSPASGSFIRLRSYLSVLVIGLLWPNTANTPCIFCLCIWQSLCVYWYQLVVPGPHLNPQERSEMQLLRLHPTNTMSETPGVETSGLCVLLLSSDAHTHPSTTCTSKPSGDVTAVPAHESLGTKWGFCVPSIPTSLHVSGGKGLFLICITLTVGHDLACTHRT